MSMCGTPEYLAPEVILRLGHGKTFDWWTLGCIIYEMLTGLPPFYSKNRNQLFENIKTSTVNYPRTFSPILINLLEGLLEKNPERRLGYGVNGSEDIKKHPWFMNINWDAMYNKKYKAPFIPQCSTNEDTCNFSEEFTESEIYSMDTNSLD